MQDAKLKRPSVAVIVPLLNEVVGLPSLLGHLEQIEADEIILVDGGSDDGSLALLQASDFTWLSSDAGRGLQMNKGAQQAKSDYLLFLHADTRLPSTWRAHLGGQWGRYNVKFEQGAGRGLSFKALGFAMVARFMNWRSRLSGIATGDQAIFVKRALFESIGGYSSQPIMEDVALSKRLLDVARPKIVFDKVSTSARRWEKDGLWRTIVLMWRLRLAYAFGSQPTDLKQYYRDVR